jgi:8-oxo-dGTP pyrophosphatase MutT (NUDIX family)
MPLPLNWETARKRAAGVVVLRRTSGVWRALILRAFSNWDFPKGLIEPGESPLEAAIRETREETGVPIRLVSLLNVYSYDGVGIVLVVFVAEPESNREPEALDECEEVGYFAFRDIPWDEIGFSSTHDALREVIERGVPAREPFHSGT